MNCTTTLKILLRTGDFLGLGVISGLLHMYVYAAQPLLEKKGWEYKDIDSDYGVGV